MIQSFKLLLIVFASCVMADSYAQSVFLDGGGRVVIDASAILHTTVPKARTTDATLSTEGTNTLTNISSKVSDEKVFQKFEVRKSKSPQPLPWLTAIGYCHDLLEDGGGWRLPTARELSLMYLLRYDLNRVPGFTPVSSYAWSATGSGSADYYRTKAFALTGVADFIIFEKTETAYAYCIRDITP